MLLIRHFAHFPSKEKFKDPESHTQIWVSGLFPSIPINSVAQTIEKI